MNESLKKAYQDKMNAELKELSAKVEVVKAQIAKGSANIRIDFHNEIESWQKKEETFK